MSIKGTPAGLGPPIELSLLLVSAKLVFQIELKRRMVIVTGRMPDRNGCTTALAEPGPLDRAQLQSNLITEEFSEDEILDSYWTGVHAWDRFAHLSAGEFPIAMALYASLSQLQY
jgi:hypothetical protein